MGDRSSSEQIPDEIVVSIGVFGETLDPAEVTRLVDLQPTSTGLAGQVGGVLNKERSRGHWVREVRRFAPAEPNDMMRELLPAQSYELEAWCELATNYELRADFVLHTEHGGQHRLNAEWVKRLAAMGASLLIYVQAYGPDA